MRKALWACCLCSVALMAGRQWFVIGAEAAAQVAVEAGQGRSAAVERLREGTVLTEQVGRFQLAGDRIMFYLADGGQRLGTLENLNLERVAKLVADSPDPLEWTVSGMVTEFQGVNYLLVERAVLKNRQQRRTAGQK